MPDPFIETDRSTSTRRFRIIDGAPDRRPELHRFAELLQAFVELGGERRDLQLRGAASPPPLGFAVRLQPLPTSAGAEMVLWLRGARLSAWSCSGGAHGVEFEEKLLELDLSSGFRWQCLLFPDADTLARTLLQLMEEQVARRS